MIRNRLKNEESTEAGSQEESGAEFYDPEDGEKGLLEDNLSRF